jgi:hypothetical protein
MCFFVKQTADSEWISETRRRGLTMVTTDVIDRILALERPVSIPDIVEQQEGPGVKHRLCSFAEVVYVFAWKIGRR